MSIGRRFPIATVKYDDYKGLIDEAIQSNYNL